MNEPAIGSSALELSFSLMPEVEPPPGVDADELERLTDYVLRTEGAGGQWDITVALVDDSRLQALHRDFMGIDTPTDIMTFPADEPRSDVRGGELVISVDQAGTQAPDWGNTPSEEIRFLVVHGLLHLLGWRDDRDEERNRMLEHQRTLFKRWEQSRESGRG